MRYQLDGINCDFKRPAPGSFIIDGIIDRCLGKWPPGGGRALLEVNVVKSGNVAFNSFDHVNHP